MFAIEQGEHTAEMRRPLLDPRSVCNLMLDEADRNYSPISHLALQKLLYFSHALYLQETKQPLVSGYFEAWRHGPVHPGAYQAFRRASRQPIDFRAEREDLLSGKREEILNPTDPVVVKLIRRVVLSYGPLTPARLRNISHAKGAPWDFVVNEGRTAMAFGLRITDDIISERFQYHKVSIGIEPLQGDPGEDTPFA